MELRKLKKLAYKLKAVEDTGIGGEAESAHARLDELLTREGYTRADIFGSDSTRVFHMTTLNECSRILEKVIRSVNADSEIVVEEYKTKTGEKDKNKVTVKVLLSNEDYAEVVNKYRFFWKAYNEERELLFSAFLNRHGNYFVPERKAKNEEGGGYGSRFGGGDAEEIIQHKLEVFNPKELKRVSVIMSALKPLQYLKKSQESFVKYFKTLGKGDR